MTLESVQDGICVLDKEGYIIYVNAAYLRILGQSKEALLGKNINETAPDGARFKVLKTGKAVYGEIRKKDNGVTIIANVNPIIVDGEMMGVVSVVKNITEMQSLIEKLKHVSAKVSIFQPKGEGAVYKSELLGNTVYSS